MKRALALAAVAAALAGCGGGSDPEPASQAPAAQLVDVDGIEPLREQFNRDEGTPRLLLLFSPT